MERDQPEAPTGLPYTGRVSEHGHPWEQPADRTDQFATPAPAPPPAPRHVPEPASAPPAAEPLGTVVEHPARSLRNTPVGEHGSLAGSAWDQRARRPIPFHRLVLVQARVLMSTTRERLLCGLAALALLALTWLAATQVNQAGPDGPVYRIFGLVLACQVAPVPLYAIVLNGVRAEWYYRTTELALTHRPGRTRMVTAQLLALLPLWPVVALVQAGVYLVAEPTLAPAWVLGVAVLGGVLSLLFLLAIGLLVANPALAVAVYVVLSTLYVVRVRNPLVLRWIDPWQPASKLAGSVPELLPSITSGTLLALAVVAGAVLASRR